MFFYYSLIYLVNLNPKGIFESRINENPLESKGNLEEVTGNLKGNRPLLMRLMFPRDINCYQERLQMIP